MPHSIAGSSSAGGTGTGTGSTGVSSLDFELALQEEDDVNEDELNALQRCWRKIRIPFEVQVIGLMTIPIICLCIFSIMIFANTAMRHAYVQNHAELIRLVFDCSEAVNDERATTNVYINANLLNNASNATRNAHTQMMRSRDRVDDVCIQTATTAYGSKDPMLRDGYSNELRDLLQENQLLRYRVDNQLISGTEYRDRSTEVITETEAALSFMSQNSLLREESLWMLQLRGLRFVENYLVRVRGVGGAWLQSIETGVRDRAIRREITNVESAFEQYLSSLQDIVTDDARVIFTEWLEHPDTIRTLEEFPRVVAGTSAMSAVAWQELVTTPLMELRALGPQLVELLTKGEQVNRELQIEGFKLGGAVLASVLAAAYIVRAQVVSTRQVTDEVKESKKLHRAVTKFVPKSFLKLMGCTSVTHIVAGDQTEVAVAMLFADIHDFNTIAATMECEQLFDWLEIYFEQMSTITDRANGFVDKFIGDALFCVYMNATEAVESAIEMTAMTDQLNREIVCGGGKQTIHIGIGIHHAIVAAGILGDSRRHTCTLVSSDVNLASRLEGLTKFYGVRIVASLSSIELCDRRLLAYRRLGLVRCKGRANGVEIADIFQTDPLELKLFKRDSLEEFHRAVDHQIADEVIEAHKIYQKLREEATVREVVDRALDLKLLQTESVDQMCKK